MAELVHEGADAVHLVLEVYLVGAGIVVEAHAVVHIRNVCGLAEVPRVGPHGLCGGAVAEVLAVAGVEDEDIVYPAVAVHVVLREVHLVVEYVAGVDEHLVGAEVVAVAAVLAVIGHGMRQAHRAVDVERRLELTGGLLHEPVACAPGPPEVGVTLLIEHVGELLPRVGDGKGEVGIFHEYHHSAHLALCRESGGHESRRALGGAAQSGLPQRLRRFRLGEGGEETALCGGTHR